MLYLASGERAPTDAPEAGRAACHALVAATAGKATASRRRKKTRKRSEGGGCHCMHERRCEAITRFSAPGSGSLSRNTPDAA